MMESCKRDVIWSAWEADTSRTSPNGRRIVTAEPEMAETKKVRASAKSTGTLPEVLLRHPICRSRTHTSQNWVKIRTVVAPKWRKATSQSNSCANSSTDSRATWRNVSPLSVILQRQIRKKSMRMTEASDVAIVATAHTLAGECTARRVAALVASFEASESDPRISCICS